MHCGVLMWHTMPPQLKVEGLLVLRMGKRKRVRSSASLGSNTYDKLDQLVENLLVLGSNRKSVGKFGSSARFLFSWLSRIDSWFPLQVSDSSTSDPIFPVKHRSSSSLSLLCLWKQVKVKEMDENERMQDLDLI
ncbi:unnamed protein product [Lactuca saligna]|uniref:Uncharacterized protein n=1 Tax=Lactuca saligna TaxID=75948 RepID=A0AA35YST7_LACSI|nr:unnamed protein product [Lactuca saligna]